MPKSPALCEIETLDPVRDHQRIAFLVFAQEFPWDSQRSLELALFRTFCAPSISRILCASGEFERRPQKRYDDTEIVMSEIVEYGYDSARGREVIRRMNQIHARFAIRNEDYLYVLSTFLLEPIRWIDRYGYRATTAKEREGLLYFWREVGKRMAIRDIPDSLESFERLNLQYERGQFVFAETNRAVGTMSTQLLASWFPWPLSLLVPLGVRAMLDERALAAFGFAPPAALFRGALHLGLRARAAAVRVLPKRKRPKLRSLVTRRSYPKGYTMEELGPPAERAS